MELTFSALRARMTAYIKENLGAICIFIFLLVAGCAAGIRIVQGMNKADAAQMLASLPGIFRAQGVPWLPMLALSALTHTLCAAMVFLAGLWLPAVPLLVIGCLLQGIFLGASIGAGMAAWPASTGVCLLLLILFEAAVLAPPLLRMNVLTQKRIAAAFTKKKGPLPQTPDIQTYTKQYLGLSVGLLPSVAMQAVLIPAVFALFL